MVVALLVTLTLLLVVAVGVGAWLLVTRPAPALVPSPPPVVQKIVGAPAPDVEGLLRAGRKLDAIKAWREQTGVGLREAKDAVEKLEKKDRKDRRVRPGPPGVVPLRMVSDDDIHVHIRTGNLIDAIKLYREKTGVGVREAKSAVDAMRNRMRAS